MTGQEHPMARRRQRLRPARGEDGYAMIVTVTIIVILTMLLVVVLAQSLHNNTISTRGARRSAALGVAEAGVSWAIAALQADKTTAVVTNRAVPVADGSGGNGTATVTVQAGTPTSPGKLGFYTILSTGQTATSTSPTRTLQVVMGPPVSFTHAIYASQTLRIENNACIVGDVYARGDITFDNNATIAGTSQAQGSLISELGRILDFSGANNAKCPSTVDGEAVDASKDIRGDVLAGGGSLDPCLDPPAGAVDAAAQGFNLNNATVGGRVCNNPTPTPMPEYTFDPNLYPTVQYYGGPPPYGTPSLTAVTTANVALAAAIAGGGLDRTYVIWQDLTAFQAAGTTPPAVTLDAGTIRIADDTVIYTNVPVDFGNTTRVEAAQSCSTQEPPPVGTPACPSLQVISTYPGTPCSGGSCPSIHGGNKIEFRPEVAVLLYSHDGTIELKNDCNSAACNQSNQGSFYGNNVNTKNGLNVSYTPRIANALGFGRTQLQQVSWQEVAPCPAGQTPPC
jgi:hypothetical protein